MTVGRAALLTAAGLALGFILLPLVLVSWLSFFRDEVVVLLGGPRFQMMGPVVYGQFAGLNNWPFGAALAFTDIAARRGC